MPVPEAYQGEGRGGAPRAASRRRSSTTTSCWRSTSAAHELSLRGDPARPSGRRPSPDAIVPVLCGASFKNKGVQALLDAVIDYLPEPDGRPADPGPPAAARRDPRRALRLRRRAVRRAGVQDRDRPLRRPADLLPGVLRLAQVAAATSTTAPRTSGSGSAGCCRCTPTSGRRSRKCSPATSPRPSASRIPGPATRSATRRSRSSSRR